MNLKNFDAMDGNILLSIINMKLRDDFPSLDELVTFYELDKVALEKKLKELGFAYQATQNRFKHLDTHHLE